MNVYIIKNVDKRAKSNDKDKGHGWANIESIS